MPKSDSNALAKGDSTDSLGSLPDSEKVTKKKSKPTSITPGSKKKSKQKKDTTLLDLVINQDNPDDNQEPKFDIMHLVTFNEDAFKQDGLSYHIDRDYLKLFKNPKDSVERLYSVPYYLMHPEPNDWDFFGNTLYLHTALSVFNKLDVDIPLIHTLNQALSFLFAISTHVPSRFTKFLETYDEEAIMRLRHLTVQDRAVLTTIRSMGKNFTDKKHFKKRTILTARAAFIDDLESLETTIATFDSEQTLRKKVSATPTSSQPITIVREDNNNSLLAKPFQSFTVTATSTWSEIISNMSESFLKNPFTAKFGNALRNSDYSGFKTELEDVKKTMDPKSYGPFMTTIKSSICDHLCSFQPQVNRNTTIDLPFYDFLMYWKDVYAGDRSINTRLKENTHALSSINLVRDGVKKGLIEAARLQLMIQDDYKSIPNNQDMPKELPYFTLYPHLLAPYGNNIPGLDSQFFKALNAQPSNSAKLVFLQKQSATLLLDADTIDASLAQLNPASSRRNTSTNTTSSDKNNSKRSQRNYKDKSIKKKEYVNCWNKFIDHNYKMLPGLWHRFTKQLQEEYTKERTEKWGSQPPRESPTQQASHDKRSRDQYHRYDDGYERNVRRVIHDDRRPYQQVRFNETPHQPPPPGYHYHNNYTPSESATTSVSSLSHYGPPPPSYRRND